VSLKKKAISGVFWNVSANGFNQVTSFVVYILLARVVAVEEFGLVAFSFLILEFCNIFIAMGINQNLIQRKEWNDDFSSSAFWVFLGVSIILACLQLLIIAPSVHFFYSEKGGYIIATLAIIPILNGLKLTHKAKLQREFKNKRNAGIESIAILFGGILSIFLALKDYGAWSIVAGRILQAILSTSLTLISSDFKPTRQVSPQHVDEIKSFGMPMLLISLLTFFSSKSINLIIGIFLGPTIFAFITVARRPFNVLLELTMQPLNKILLPMISRVKDDEVANTYYRLIAITAFVVLPIYIGLGSVAEQFIRLSVGEKWLSSVNLMYLISLIAPTFVITWYLSTLLISRGKTKPALKITKIVCASNIIFPLLFVYWGIEAVCISFVCSAYLTVPIRFNIAKEYFNLSLYEAIKVIMPFVVSSLLMFITLASISYFKLILFDYLFLNIISMILLGGIIYLGTLVIFFRPKFNLVLQEIKHFK
jgi:O-antigen/teichoic acid export membrane protein